MDLETKGFCLRIEDKIELNNNNNNNGIWSGSRAEENETREEAGKDQVNIETLKAGDETIAKQVAKLYTKCITERRIPKTWKEANMVIFFQEREQKMHKKLQTNLLAIKYVQTVHKNNNN